MQVIALNNSVLYSPTSLAIEEYFFRETSYERVMIMWRDLPGVVIGKNQEVSREVDVDAAKVTGATLTRRMSGGGTVYLDQGNFNFSIIGNGGTALFEEAAQHLCDTFRRLGLPVEMNDRKSIYLQGKKVSGSAQRLRKDRAMFHATLLYNSDLELMHRLLDVKAGQKPYIFRPGYAVESVRDEVGNVVDLMDWYEPIEHFEDRLFSEWISPYEPSVVNLSHLPIDEVEQIEQRRYLDDKWTYYAIGPEL